MPEQRRQIAPTKPTLFIDDVLDVSERGDVFGAIASSGPEVYSIAFSPHVTLKAIELLQAAYDKWAAGNRAAQGIRNERER
jgi:hypothetical protein